MHKSQAQSIIHTTWNCLILPEKQPLTLSIWSVVNIHQFVSNWSVTHFFFFFLKKKPFTTSWFEKWQIVNCYTNLNVWQIWLIETNAACSAAGNDTRHSSSRSPRIQSIIINKGFGALLRSRSTRVYTQTFFPLVCSHTTVCTIQGNLKGASVVAAILPTGVEASYCTSGFFRS